MSVYSVVAAVIFYNFFFALVIFLRKKTSYLEEYAVSSLLFLTVLAVLRLLLPLDTKYARIIRSSKLVPFIQSILAWEPLGVGLSLGRFLLLVWVVGTVGVLVYNAVRSIRNRRLRARWYCFPNTAAHRIAEELGIRAEVRVTAYAQDHCVEGILHPVIYITFPIQMDDSELRYILQHEQCHIRRCDNLKKLVFEVIQALFWWNPATYKFTQELGRMLEMECDNQLRRSLSEEDYQRYTLLLMEMSKEQKDQPVGVGSRFTGYMSDTHQRLALLDKPLRPKNRKAQILVCCLFVLLFLGSYLVILQPAYANPAESEVTGVVAIDSESAYILFEDGNYFLFLNGSGPIPITEDDLELPPYNSLEIISGGN